jgi:hypothetical protein
MSNDTQKWAAAAFGFAVAVVWATVGAQAALTSVLGAGLCAGIVLAREGGLVARLGGVATETRRRIQAAVPAPSRPARAEPRRRPQSAPAQQRQAPAQQRQAPAPTPAPAAPAPVVRPYNHDETSSEHVYEVANYGW